jgi:hypothetical protein
MEGFSHIIGINYYNGFALVAKLNFTLVIHMQLSWLAT